MRSVESFFAPGVVMTRRWFLFLFLGLITLSIFGTVCLQFTWLAEPAVAWRNFKKVKVGMTVSAVEAILGKPDRKLGRGDYLPSSYPRETESEQFFLWTG